MDKELLKKMFLEYMQEQVRKQENISADTLVEIASSEEKANEIMQELEKEGFITYSSMIMNLPAPTFRFKNYNKIELTEKGMKEVENKLLNNIERKEKENRKNIIGEDTVNKNQQNLSVDEKYKQIKKDILVFFYELSQDPCLLFDDDGNPYTLTKVRSKLRNIILEYFKSSSAHLEYIINQVLYEKKLITYKYGKNFIDDNKKIGLANFITEKGVKYLEENYDYCPNKTLGELTENEYISTYGNIVPKLSSTLAKLATGININPLVLSQINAVKNAQQTIGLNSSALNIAQQIANSQTSQLLQNSAFSKLTQQYNIMPHLESIQNHINANYKALNNATQITQAAQDAIKAANIASKQHEQTYNTIDKNIKKESVDSTEKHEAESFTFEGILGQNCGLVEKPTGEDEKRLQIKGFKVTDGIKVLRGFAKSSDLAEFSQADENYQRDKQLTHLKSLMDFMKNIKDSAKYLPEVTLAARGYQNLSRINLSGSLNVTQKGELDNLEYWKLTVNKNQIYRIDGNHRLEATKDESYYIPFSIIVWENSEVNIDDEAFLFYFLNSKAKKLTTEENLKGLVNSSTWEPYELDIANQNICLLQYLQKEIESNNFISSHFCQNKPLVQISEILEKIKIQISIDSFKTIIAKMNDLLIKDKWKNLKKFDFYCQLIFYVAYKNEKENEGEKILDNLEYWVKKYNFDNETFNDPILLYKNAEKTNNLNPINIFIAMPFYDEDIIENFNELFVKLKEELEKKYSVLDNRLNIFEVMTHRGYAIDIQQQIIEQIKLSNIFIADISEHKCKKGGRSVNSHANPNVMYELGLAKQQKHTEIILLKNKKDKIDVPSDLITKYYNRYEKDKLVQLRNKLFEAIEGILKDKFNII